MERTGQRDARFEAVFSRWGLEFEYVSELSLSDELEVLDGAQVRNLSNIAPMEQVDQYTLQMKQGANFPPLVVAKQLRDKTDVLIDGNTRAQAARRNRLPTFPAYRVWPIPDDDFAKLLGAALNQLGGQRLNPEEAYKAAVAAMVSEWTDEQIALELGLSASTVRDWRQREKFRVRAEGLGIEDAASKLIRSQEKGLAKISRDEPFKQMVELVAIAKPPKEELAEVLTRIQEAGSDQAELDVVNEARGQWKAIGPAPGKVRRNERAQQARMHLGGLLKIEDPALVFDSTRVEEDYAKWLEAKALIDRVLEVFEKQREVVPA